MRLIDALALAAGRLLGWGFVAIALMMTWEVGARYIANAPTIWAHEVSGLLAATAFIFGGAYCMVTRSHMAVTLLTDCMGPRTRRFSEALSLAVGAIYLAGMSLAAWTITGQSLLRFGADGAWMPQRSGTSWDTPAPAFLKLALFLGAVLFLAVVVRQAVALVRGDER